jgi:flagellar biosynthesis protein FlhG
MTSKIFCLTSGKGGVGKTSLSVNLAWTLARQGVRVLVVDGDLGLANADVLLGLTVTRTIRHVLEQGHDPLEALVYPLPTLGVLPASSGVPEIVHLGPEDQEQLAPMLTALSRRFQLTFIDTAAGIGASVLWFATLADHLILVINPDPTSLTDAYALIKVLAQGYQRREFSLLVNSVKSDEEAYQTFDTLAQVATRFLKVNVRYLGAVPLDRAVTRAVREQTPFVQLFPKSKAARAVTGLAARLSQDLALAL